MYYFYLGKMLCPVAPSKLQMKVNGQNKTMTLINEGQVNIIKKTGLTDVSFDLLLPNVKYPFATYKSGFKNAGYFLEELEKLKTSEEPFQFIVTRDFPNGKLLFDTNMKVTLEDYTIQEDAKQGFDVVVSVKLKQYKEFGTKTYDVVTSNNTKPTLSVQSPPRVDSTNKPGLPTSYTIQKGDTLWAIAKKYYGNGAKYNVIHEANKTKIVNANLIYPGQVITIPKI